MAVIDAEGIGKNFKVYQRQKGFLKNVMSLFNRKFETVHAVQDISFSIDQGELVGYVGSNGAGKSTTVKILCGILVPTSGTVRVNGLVPYEKRKENAKSIGVVFGQRSQLNWDLPTEDTFELYKKMYKIDEKKYRHNVSFFTGLLDMKEFIRKPVRQLSLGQKMRAEIAVALLHDPKILYLDEPTIGLDVVVKDRIRKFLRNLRDEKGTTIILTTHDMEDIDQICQRIILIDKGKKLVDEPLPVFKKRYNDEYYVEVEFDEEPPEIHDHRFILMNQMNKRVIYNFNRNVILVKDAMKYFINSFGISDIIVRNQRLDEIIKDYYKALA
jgi:ABC-2 type transport system ATP-binding protein